MLREKFPQNMVWFYKYALSWQLQITMFQQNVSGKVYISVILKLDTKNKKSNVIDFEANQKHI